jgi:hypothetical protein
MLQMPLKKCNIRIAMNENLEAVDPAVDEILKQMKGEGRL